MGEEVSGGGASEVKACTKCGVVQPIECFSKGKAYRGGRRAQCKDCAAVLSRAHYQANAEAVRQASQARYAADPQRHARLTKAWYASNSAAKRATADTWNTANPEKVRAHGRAAAARRLARKAGVACDPSATLESVVHRWGLNCYICGTETDMTAPRRAPNKAELEHVIPLSKGGPHTLDNLRCACHRCNQRKGAHRTAEEVRALVAPPALTTAA